VTESPILNEWIEQASAERELRTLRKAVVDVLNRRFPGQVPADLVDTIKSQPSSDLLSEWLIEAAALSLDEFRAYLRR
jgi:hypothetical protein